MLAPITVAIAGIGVYSIASTLLWGRFLFGVPLHISHPLLFAVSIPATVLSIGLLGLVLASTLVLYRARELARAGARVPDLADHRDADPALAAARLGQPDRLGARAHLGHARGAASGARRRRRHAAPRSASRSSVAYTAIAALLLHHFERLARDRATLSLT